MLLAMVKDLRVILVKLADRLHNMQTIDALEPEKRRRIAKETLEIYAPIANRLGIYSLKVELEDLGFKTYCPFRYRVLERTLRKASGSQKQFLRKIESKLRKNLADQGIEGKLVAREKHLYGIYSKMRKKHIHLSDIVDVFGLRIIVADIDSCYRVLGLVHQLYRPMPGRFKDYISIPRVNSYQSLHTTLFGPGGTPLEVQIRTEEMDRVAERGIAAHWQYKAVDKNIYNAEARAREWLTGLMEMQKAANSEEFLETVKVDLFPDKVYVFTPKGDILRLPRGATAVDFAYAVHTDVGNRCVAAKIDRRLVPLKTTLRNGETVEILTARGAKPNPTWVNFVKTAKARNAIRAYLKGLRRDEARELGRRLLSQALRPYSLNLRRLRKAQLERLLSELNVEDMEDVYEQLGLGERLAPILAGLLAQQEISEDGEIADKRKPLDIAGTEGLLVAYARCCNPIPGDEIIGFMSTGRGIVIHRTSCNNVVEDRNHPTKWIPVDWRRGIKGEFQSEIHVRMMNRVGLLAEVAGRISATQSNIDNVTVEADGDASTLSFRLNVRDRRHLAQVIRSLRANPGVVRVSRTAG
ncbi:MAG: bifunctional (p)ppGpp synthetase/guanosine-3',5'-bis(diphosphate) 3'-pyrophosphohydrolase, partial [Gammaproteobacteria bacterium]